MTYEPDYDRVHATLTDPVLVTARDGAMFVCWHEDVGIAHLRAHYWVFVSMTRVRYLGPKYFGEDSLETIRAMVDEWWEMKKSLGQAE